MTKSITINNHKELTANKKIALYIKPQIIYVPLENKSGVQYKHLVKEGDYVYKGDIVAINKDINFPVHSSVSGYVTKGIKKTISNGNKIRCIVIENDFKEKYRKKIGAKKIINNYSKEEFLELLQASGITGLGGSDFPTFMKYRAIDNYEYLIVNGVECEPFITADHALMLEHAEDILECIDALLEIMKIKKAYVAVKEYNSKVVSAFNKYKGSYPNINIVGVRDAYPNGWERNLVNNILGITYNRYPSEKKVLVSNVSTIYAIYEMLKYNRPLTERVITITGKGVQKPVNIRVKIGAAINEILYYLEGYKTLKEPLFIAGGPMMGNSLSSDDLIVTKDLSCVIVMENKFTNEQACIRCGKCIDACPVGIMPILIRNNLDKPNRLKNLEPSKCIECGLCSYVCPAKIEIREYVRKAKGGL